MPDFVQEGVYPLGARREVGADPDEAVGPRVRDGQPESLRDAGGDIEVRNVVDAVAGRETGGVKKLGWPKVNRAFLRFVYVMLTALRVLGAATAVPWPKNPPMPSGIVSKFWP
jgi:hypothetical protein